VTILCVALTTVAKSVILAFVAPRMDTVETQPIIAMLDASQHTDLAAMTPHLPRVVLAVQVLEILLAPITNAAVWLDTVGQLKTTVRIQEAANWDTVAATPIRLLLDSQLPTFLDP
jgi:hypothetical protein